MMQTRQGDARASSLSVRKLVDSCIPTFDDFWKAWPKREAKKDAMRAWAKLRPESRVAALSALPAHVDRWRNEGRIRNHIPHPATWLNGERWEDELGEVFAPVQKPVQPNQVWWTSHVLMERKGREVGVGAPRPGETGDQYRVRIQVAIEEQKRFGSS